MGKTINNDANKNNNSKSKAPAKKSTPAKTKVASTSSKATCDPQKILNNLLLMETSTGDAHVPRNPVFVMSGVHAKVFEKTTSELEKKGLIKCHGKNYLLLTEEGRAKAIETTIADNTTSLVANEQKPSKVEDATMVESSEEMEDATMTEALENRLGSGRPSRKRSLESDSIDRPIKKQNKTQKSPANTGKTRRKLAKSRPKTSDHGEKEDPLPSPPQPLRVVRVAVSPPPSSPPSPRRVRAPIPQPASLKGQQKPGAKSIWKSRTANGAASAPASATIPFPTSMTTTTTTTTTTVAAPPTLVRPQLPPVAPNQPVQETVIDLTELDAVLEEQPGPNPWTMAAGAVLGAASLGAASFAMGVYPTGQVLTSLSQGIQNALAAWAVANGVVLLGLLGVAFVLVTGVAHVTVHHVLPQFGPVAAVGTVGAVVTAAYTTWTHVQPHLPNVNNYPWLGYFWIPTHVAVWIFQRLQALWNRFIDLLVALNGLAHAWVQLLRGNPMPMFNWMYTYVPGFAGTVKALSFGIFIIILICLL